MPRVILIVEDDPSLAENLTLALSLLPDSEVLVAWDGAQGRLLFPRADALCTDLDLPRVHGEVLIAEFRQLKPHAPIIAMSASPGLNIDERVRALGADIFFHKPYSTLKVRDTLKGLLDA